MTTLYGPHAPTHLRRTAFPRACHQVHGSEEYRRRLLRNVWNDQLRRQAVGWRPSVGERSIGVSFGLRLARA